MDFAYITVYPVSCIYLGSAMSCF